MISKIDELSINTIRILSAEAVQRANSGHPGAPMGAAPLGFTLFHRIMRFNPQDPAWLNRDRFVLSAGHASMLLYSLLHLNGYAVSLEDIKNFRQWGSMTPGHPEYGLTPGVETTTGPLGQGFAHAVGMAMAQAHLGTRFNRPKYNLFNHFIFGLMGDGDMQEGVTGEAASLAGHLKLGRLIFLYDDNSIQIEGSTSLTCSDDVRKRFEGYRWHVAGPVDGNDLTAVENAVQMGMADDTKPTLVICKTHIGYGSPNKVDSADAHGAPLGEDEIERVKETLGWPHSEPFVIPDTVRAHFDTGRERAMRGYDRWEKMWRDYQEHFPDEAAELNQLLTGDGKVGWQAALDAIGEPESSMATRAANGKALNAVKPFFPGLLGGSADLAPSNKTMLKDAGDFAYGSYAASNIHFGVREHTMGAIVNGLTLSGLRAYGGTFLVFADYMKPAIRLAALMKLPSVFIFTHDSIGVGEDGPTHQAVEQLAMLRAIPDVVVLRPADAQETTQAWQIALERKNGPTVLVFTRQKTASLPKIPADAVSRGGYTLLDADDPERLIIATGSEVGIALEAARELIAEGKATRVVSLPSWELFRQQPAAYRDDVLLPGISNRLVVEAGSPLGWHEFAGRQGNILAMTTFGASAP
ncbi:MAG: transketolase, partial [Candidatus Marinimicrobia bacterium]|nr:transketolase [Candidatus Neomarinimicrobiota bacterium]